MPDKELNMRFKTIDKKSQAQNEPLVINGWPNGLADQIRSAATPSEFDYSKQPMMSREELEKALAQPSGIDPAIAAKHVCE